MFLLFLKLELNHQNNIKVALTFKMASAPRLSLSIQEGNSCRHGEMFANDKTNVQSH